MVVADADRVWHKSSSPNGLYQTAVMFGDLRAFEQLRRCKDGGCAVAQ